VATAIPPGDHTGETGTEEKHRRRFGNSGDSGRLTLDVEAQSPEFILRL
jgi:hypothetical protein